MDAAPPEYDVIITESAERAFFEILDYLFTHYSDKRAERIAKDLLDEPLRLSNFPMHWSSGAGAAKSVKGVPVYFVRKA